MGLEGSRQKNSSEAETSAGARGWQGWGGEVQCLLSPKPPGDRARPWRRRSDLKVMSPPEGPRPCRAAMCSSRRLVERTERTPTAPTPRRRARLQQIKPHRRAHDFGEKRRKDAHFPPPVARVMRLGWGAAGVFLPHTPRSTPTPCIFPYDRLWGARPSALLGCLQPRAVCLKVDPP